MTIRIAGTLKAIYYNQVLGQVVVILQDRTQHTLLVPVALCRETNTAIGLTQPGDEVEIVAFEPGVYKSAVKTWKNLTLTRWLSK